jgi:hypothetical protein
MAKAFDSGLPFFLVLTRLLLAERASGKLWLATTPFSDFPFLLFLILTSVHSFSSMMSFSTSRFSTDATESKLLGEEKGVTKQELGTDEVSVCNECGRVELHSIVAIDVLSIEHTSAGLSRGEAPTTLTDELSILVSLLGAIA